MLPMTGHGTKDGEWIVLPIRCRKTPGKWNVNLLKRNALETMPRQIFVFGSNLQGRHGKGAAKAAVDKYGAIYGVPEGIQGDSYGIPTKSNPWQTLPLHRIKAGVERFITYAQEHPQLEFILTPIGCGLAGYTPHEIAPMFKDAPSNVVQPPEFVDVNENGG